MKLRYVVTINGAPIGQAIHVGFLGETGAFHSAIVLDLDHARTFASERDAFNVAVQTTKLFQQKGHTNSFYRTIWCDVCEAS